MKLAISKRQVGIICRDVGFLSRPTGEFDIIDLKVNHSYPRKGNLNYATALLRALHSWQLRLFNEVLIVGDGEGDVRLCSNLDDLTKEMLEVRRVRGLFIRHEGTERSSGGFQNVALFDTWEDLAKSLRDVLRSFDSVAGTAAIVFCDVDRTILLPRMKADDDYLSVRLGGIADYVSGFRQGALIEPEGIQKYVDHVTANLREYTNGMNDLCFKNEEAVAIVTLLLAVGTVIPKWVSGSDPYPLAWMIRHSIEKLEHGAWISGLDLVLANGAKYLSGERVWKRDTLILHLQSILSDLNEEKPVLCPEFRDCEWERLSRFIARGQNNTFNSAVLSAVRLAMPAGLLFVTDRPAQSLGLSAEHLNDGLGAASFWSELRSYLIP
jgi:hypothetical protein